MKIKVFEPLNRTKEIEMGLLKLSSPSKDDDSFVKRKALEVLNSVPSQSLILGAYLFGSAAHGNFNQDSDLDILVIVKDLASIKQLQSEVYAPRFADIAIDWIIKVEDEFHSKKDFGGVCFEAFHHGKKLR